MRILILIITLITSLSCAQEESDPNSNQINQKSKSNSDGQNISGTQSMNLAHIESDTFLSGFFGSEIFQEHIYWNKNRSFVNCETPNGVEIYNFNEKVHRIPVIYDFKYSIIIGNDTVYSFKLNCDKSMQFDFPTNTYSTGKMQAYKYLLEGKFSIDYYKALDICKKNGTSFSENSLELEYKRDSNMYSLNSYYWETHPLNMVENMYYSCLKINPINGELDSSQVTLINIE